MQDGQRKAPEGELPVEQLSDYLDSVGEDAFDLATVDAFLEQMEATTPSEPFDGEKALKTFRERHGELLEEPKLQVLPKPRRRGWRLTGRIAAVAASVAVCCLMVCQAMGFDVLGIIGRWSEEQFWFEMTATPPPAMETAPVRDVGDSDEIIRKSYDDLETALEENGFAALAPGWVPEGFVLESVDTIQMFTVSSVNAYYSRGEENIIFVLRRYENAESVGSAIYEKDENPVVEYEHDGVTFYIMNNLSRKSVAWRDGLVEGMLTGNFTEEEAKQIIDSMG